MNYKAKLVKVENELNIFVNNDQVTEDTKFVD